MCECRFLRSALTYEFGLPCTWVQQIGWLVGLEGMGREDLVVPRSDEQQVATSITSGWPETFEGFYLDSYEPMVRLAALITRRRGVAEDIVQDVFRAMAPRWDAIDHFSCNHRRRPPNERWIQAKAPGRCRKPGA